MVIKMATTQDFIDYLYDQVNEKWSKRYRKMFGVYIFYINEKLKMAILMLLFV